MKKLISILFIFVFICGISLAKDSYNDATDFRSGSNFYPDVVDWDPIYDAAGDWCPTGTYSDLPAATYIQEARWLGDAVFVHTPSTTWTPTNTIIK